MKRGVGLTFQRKYAGRVLLLAWEWTPCAEATALEHQRMGRDVHVITCRQNGQSDLEIQSGLHLHRVDAPEGDPTTVLWSANLNNRLAAMGSLVLTTYGTFELLVAHDEQVADGTAVLAEKARLPICAPTPESQHRPLSTMEVNR